MNPPDTHLRSADPLPAYGPTIAAVGLVLIALGVITRQDWLLEAVAMSAAGLVAGAACCAVLLPHMALPHLGLRLMTVASAAAVVWLVAALNEPTTQAALMTREEAWPWVLTVVYIALVGVLCASAAAMIFARITDRTWSHVVLIALSFVGVVSLVLARKSDGPARVTLTLPLHICAALTWSGLAVLVAVAFMKVEVRVTGEPQLIALHRSTPGTPPFEWFRTVVSRFSRVAGICVLLVAGSALLMLWGSPLLDTDKTYGVLLWVKIGLAGGLVLSGGIHRLFTRIRMLPFQERESTLTVRMAKVLPRRVGEPVKDWLVASSKAPDARYFLRVCYVELGLFAITIGVASALLTHEPW